MSRRYRIIDHATLLITSGAKRLARKRPLATDRFWPPKELTSAARSGASAPQFIARKQSPLLLVSGDLPRAQLATRTAECCQR